MGVTVITGHQLEALFDELCRQLVDSPPAPMETETILVPGLGIARWLELRLADRLSVAAGVQMPFIGSWLHTLTDPRSADEDPFAREVLVWRLWRLLDDCRSAKDEKQRFGAASHYVRDDLDGRKHLQLCRRLSARFDDYQLYRDDLLEAFAAGHELRTLSPDAPWQSRLWRALLEDAGVETTTPNKQRKRSDEELTLPLFPDHEPKPDAPKHGRPHRLAALRSLLDDPAWRQQNLPKRLQVFGATTTPPAFLDVLHRIGRHLDVRIYVPQPTPHFIGDLRERRDQPGEHGLLARLGTESREFQSLLIDLEERSEADATVTHLPIDGLTDDEGPAATLLGCIQRDVVQAFDRADADDALFRQHKDDDSLRVHDCHSPQRELQVVRDQICAALDSDPTLRPCDVMVLVPDVDRYAPYVHAVFGPLKDRLPVHLADRHPARELPLCRATLHCLQLSRARLTLSEVLHLVETPAVQRRFRLFPQDVATLRHLCESAGVRWGLDGESRHEQLQLPAFDDNSWRQGLDRLLLGNLTGPINQLVCGHAPVADTTEARAELLTRFLHFTDTLFAQVTALRRPQPLASWAERFDELITALFEPREPAEEEAERHLRRATAALRRQAVAARHDAPVELPVMQSWLEDALAHAANSHRGGDDRSFLGGAITFAAMLPMRAVPVRALFICGLDDQSFPRRDATPHFDLIAAKPRAGDRNRRLDDRQLFLDLLLAARDRLHLTFVGHTAKDNAKRAPSTVISELLEHIDRTCEDPAPNVRPSSSVLVQHPLQPWSPRYRGGDPRLFTYGQQPAIELSDDPPAPWCPADEAITTPDPSLLEHVQLSDLLDFWWHPCAKFLTRSLRVRVKSDKTQDDSEEPFDLDQLASYSLTKIALLRAKQGDSDGSDPLEWARATGVLPVGPQGDAAFHHLQSESSTLLEEAQKYASTRSRAIDARVGKVRLTGTLDGFDEDARTYMRADKLKPKDKLRAWIEHLTLCLQASQHASAKPRWPACTRVVSGGAPLTFQDVDPADAERYLGELIDLYRHGLSRPLTFFEHSSYSAGKSAQQNSDPAKTLQDARKKYEGGGRDEPHQFDLGDAAIALCMRDRDPISDGEGREFFRLAAQVWSPLLTHLEQTVK